jgi:hypothetical protein
MATACFGKSFRNDPAIHDPGGNSHRRRSVWHITDYDGVRANTTVAANSDISHNFCAGPNEYMVTQQRALPPFGTDGHLMFDIDMLAPSDSAVDYDSRRVHEDKTPAELRPSADDAVTKQDVPLVEEHFQGNQLPAPCPLHEAVTDHGDSAIGDQSLKNGPHVDALVAPLRLGEEIGLDKPP